MSPAAPGTPGMPVVPLAMLGDPLAEACVDGVCSVPEGSPAATQDDGAQQVPAAGRA